MRALFEIGTKAQNMLEREAKVLEILMREGYFGIG